MPDPTIPSFEVPTGTSSPVGPASSGSSPAAPLAPSPAPTQPTSFSPPTPPTGSTGFGGGTSAPTSTFTPPPPPPTMPESGGGNKIRIFFLVALVVAVLGLLVFFLKPTLPFFGGNSGPANLKYWGLWESEAVMQVLIDEYEASHPNVTIDYEKRTPTQYRETLLARLGEGAGPDIFRFHNTWLPMVDEELSELPSSVYSASEFDATFYSVIKNDLSREGKYYGIPLMFDSLALLYNEDMFQAAQLSTPPATWNDVRETYAPKLTSYNGDGSIAVAGAALGTSTNIDHFSDILGLLFLQNGTKMIEGGEVAFHKTVGTDGRNFGADVLDFYTLFAKSTFSGKGAAWSDTLPSSIEAFATGKVAMVLAPSYRIFDVLNLMAQSGKTFEVGVATVPQAVPVGQKPPIYWASYWVEGVAKKSKNQAAAWDFLKFLSSKETMRKLYTEQAKTRPFGEVPARVDLADTYAAVEYVAPYLESAKAGQSWYLASGTYDRGLNDQIITYFGDAVTAVLKNNTSSVAALTTAAQGASQVLSRYGLADPISEED